jgi:hydroxyacylglutathione hydrolase
VAQAQRELVRIGIDRPAAAATGNPGDWSGDRALRSYPVADFADLESVRHHRPVVILDVRRDQEWAQSHISGAVHIPLHQLPADLAKVPAGEVWVHCGADTAPRSRRHSWTPRAGRSWPWTTNTTGPPVRACR